MNETTDRRKNRHPGEDAIVALAEGETPGEEVRDHVETCAPCRARLQATRAVLDAIAAPPPMPDPGTFASRRERILQAIEESRDAPAPPGAFRAHARWWVPLAAAAAVGAILLVRPPVEGPGPIADRTKGIETSPGEATPVGSELPVLAEAERAAQEVALDLVGGETAIAEPGEPGRLGSEPLDLAIADLEAVDPVLSLVDHGDDPVVLEERFAELPPEERDAILEDLSTMTFDFGGGVR